MSTLLDPTITGSALPAFLGSAMNSPGWTDWSYNILIIGLIAFFAVVLLHMLANALNIASLRVWAKGEYMQVLITFLLAFAIVNLIGLAWNLMVDFATYLFFASPVLSQKYVEAGLGPDSVKFDPYVFVQSFLKTTMIGCEQTVYRTLYSVNYFYKVIATIKAETMGIEPVGGWYTTVYTSSMEYIMGHINMLLLLHWVQIRFLSIVKYAAPLMIQIGLVLRAFPMSRGAGGLLLAMGFGFFAVYPISLAMLITMQPPGVSFCTQFEPPPMMNLQNNEITADAGGVILAYYTTVANENSVMGLLEQAKSFLPLFYMQAMFYPMVALIITFTFVRQTGALFGADLNEIGRGLVKLI